jgi:dipeptidyl aminopeptidase/acylaminoacyl peptidase
MISPYGSWKSPITADLIVSESIGLGSIVLDGDYIYWVEMRPAEQGRYVIVRRASDGTRVDVTPPQFNVRTRVHEYGGGAYTVSNDIVYFSNFTDQRRYGQRRPDSPPVPFTQQSNLRFADGIVDRPRNRMICVCEDHRTAGSEPINSIVSFALDRPISSMSEPSPIIMLVAGYDFFSSPRLSPDGKQLAWLAWNHPNMPWDGTELWLAEVNADGSLGKSRVIAGGVAEAIFQPQWSPDGTLYFVSDRTGWWNLYRWRAGQSEAMCPMEAEFGLPHWGFGMSTYGFASAEQIVCVYLKQGFSQLALLDTNTKQLENIATSYSRIDGLRAGNGRAVFVAGSPTESTAIVDFDLATRQFVTLQQSNKLALDTGYISAPQAIEFPTTHGLTAHCFLLRADKTKTSARRLARNRRCW